MDEYMNIQEVPLGYYLTLLNEIINGNTVYLFSDVYNVLDKYIKEKYDSNIVLNVKIEHLGINGVWYGYTWINVDK